MNKEFLIWAAGFADGEGTITFAVNKTKKDSGLLYPRFSVVNTHHKSIHHFKDIIGCGTITPVTPDNPNGKDYLQLMVNGDSAIITCQLLIDYLYTKRRQAELILEYSKLPVTYEPRVGQHGGLTLSEDLRIKRLILNDEMKELNEKGR